MQNCVRNSVLLVFFFFVFSSFLRGQHQKCETKISGKVYDAATKLPLGFVTVQIKSLGVGVISDDAGFFEIEDICDQELDLEISHLGYTTLIHHHDPDHHFHEVFLSPESMQLEGVVVEGTKTPQFSESVTADVLSGKALEQRQNLSLGDAVSLLSGVSTVKTGQNIVKPVIHGLHTNRILILNNDLRHGFQNWGRGHAAEISAAMLNQIEVIKGAATVRYGPEALGGVIKVAPDPLPLHTGFGGEVYGQYLSNGRAFNTGLQLKYGADLFSWMVQAHTVKQGDLNTESYNLTNTGKEENGLSFGTRFHKGNVNIHLNASHLDQKLGILRGSVTGNLDDLVYAMSNEPPLYTKPFSYDIGTPYQKTAHNLIKLKSTILSGSHLFEVVYGYQSNKRREFDVRRGSLNEIPSIDLHLHTQSLDFDWDHPQNGRFKGNIGVQFTYQNNSNIAGTSTLPFIPNYAQLRFGIYAIENIDFDDFIVDVGLRADLQSADIKGRDGKNEPYANTMSYQNVTANFGITRNRKKSSFKSNLGLAWRPPNMSELYSYGKHQAIVEYGLLRYEIDENNAISTDRILSDEEKPIPAEKGIKWVNTIGYTAEKLQLESSIYANYIIDYIYSRPYGLTKTTRGTLPFFIYDQTDAVLAGADVTLQWNHHTKWNSTFRGEYVYAINTKDQTSFVGIVPPSVSYALQYTSKLKNSESVFDATVSVEYVFKQHQAPRVITPQELKDAAENGDNIFEEDNSIFDFLPAPDGYLTIDLRTSISIRQFRVGLEVLNMFNQQYRSYTNTMRYFADEPGRNIVLGIKYNF